MKLLPEALWNQLLCRGVELVLVLPAQETKGNRDVGSGADRPPMKGLPFVARQGGCAWAYPVDEHAYKKGH